MDRSIMPIGWAVPTNTPLPRADPSMLTKLAASSFLCLLLATGVFAQNPGDISTQIFGVTGKGTSFVYVFDRSLSMKGAPLAAAKRELLDSLGHLQRVHQFQ